MRKAFDVHFHYTFQVPLQESVEAFKETFALYGVDRKAFMALGYKDVQDDGNFEHDHCCNVRSLFYKYAFAPKGYAFGHLIYDGKMTDEERADDLLRQAQEFYTAGGDGFKMIEGHPRCSRFFGYQIDEPVYEKFFAFMEEKQFPIMLHLANPAENWDLEKCSEWARTHGNFYDDTYPTKEEYHKKLERVMQRHPNLKIILAHFGFMSYDVDMAKHFLDTYPNAMLDTTPGGEQLLRMDKDWAIWKPFFQKYYKRILFGTDTFNTSRPLDKEWLLIRPMLVKNFFETDEAALYYADPYTGHGKDFTSEMLDRIYYDNAYEYLGEPHPLDKVYLAEEAERVLTIIQDDFDRKDMEYVIKTVRKEK